VTGFLGQFARFGVILCRVTERSQGPAASAVRLLGSTVVFGAILFLLAGTVRWPAGWAFLAINFAVLSVYVTTLARLHPDLVQERKTPPADAKAWDKPLVAIVGIIGPFCLLFACGLDRRFRWSPAMPQALKAAGLLLLAAGGSLTNYAVLHNRFFSAVVRIQRDRGHRVVDTGPYQVLRHPGYIGSILHMVGQCLALGSTWALTVAAAVSLVLVARTALEDQVLTAELDGYADYARHVRYRLVPWVW
jgi:protein-S-isoprenylcysteine O-methyltransferase Ste14